MRLRRSSALTLAATTTLPALGLAVWSTVWPLPGSGGATSMAILLGAWALFAVGAWLVRRLPRRPAVALILLGGIVLPLLAATAPPRTSDDLYRYEWDGRVQAAGVDPYRYAPAAPELVPLRDPQLWPTKAAWCVGPGATDAHSGQPLISGCTRINRPTVHTIYPPLSQAYFRVVHALSGLGGGVLALQMTAAAAAIAVTVLLLFGLPRLSIDPRQAVLWAWCPTVALESGNNAHVDVLAAMFVGTTLLATAITRPRLRSAVTGVLLGLAVAVKLTPVLLGPALVRRRPILLTGSAVAVVTALYLPHVLAVGAGVAGYLPGYAQEEGYADGSRFALLTLLLPNVAAMPVAVAMLVVAAVAVARAADPDRPWPAATVMTGVALLVTTPMYPWYAQLLVVVVAFAGRAEWLAVAAAGYVALHAQDLHLSYTGAQQLGYGLALSAVVGTILVRRRRDVRSARAAAPKDTEKRLHQMLTLRSADTSTPAGMS
jgi:hypothetical protein